MSINEYFILDIFSFIFSSFWYNRFENLLNYIQGGIIEIYTSISRI